MGRGKTKSIIDTACELYVSDEIEVAVIACPNGAQDQWIMQLEAHAGIPYRAALFEGQMRAKAKRALDALLWDTRARLVPSEKRPPMGFLIVNIEALRKGSKGAEVIEIFTRDKRFLMHVDESHRIGNMKSAQTKGAIRFGHRKNCTHRRIGSGTMSPEGKPLALFSQYFFLDPQIIGFRSITAFKAHYCVLLKPSDPMLRGLARKIGRPPEFLQIVARDENGKELYRNLDELKKLIEPYGTRVGEDPNLPEALYKRRSFDLSKKQRAIYKQVRDKVIAEFVHDGTLHQIDTPLALARLGRLQQVAGNYFPGEKKGTMIRIEEPKDNPRMKELLEALEDADWPRTLIWARHTEEIEELLQMIPGSARRDGKIDREERAANVAAFMDGSVNVLIAQLQMSEAWEAPVAKISAHYTNGTSLKDRVQAEKRSHREGVKHSVLYLDFIARDTIDEKLVASYIDKKELADFLHGDPVTSWL